MIRGPGTEEPGEVAFDRKLDAEVHQDSGLDFWEAADAPKAIRNGRPDPGGGLVGEGDGVDPGKAKYAERCGEGG